FDLSIPAFGVSRPLFTARMKPGTPPITSSDSRRMSSHNWGEKPYFAATSFASALGRTEESETTLPSEIATNLLDTTRTSPSLRSSPTSPSVRAGRSNSESILGVRTGASEIKRVENAPHLNKEY